MLVKDKLKHVLRLKATATKFFKADSNLVKNHLKKAADLYQKINGYYNFGDSTNNFAKEDETSEEFQKDNAELQAVKLTTFNNLVVCKHKMGEFVSVLGITEQILGENMDPKNIKAMYFRGFAMIKTDDFDGAIKCLQNLVNLEPKHAEGQKLLQHAKKERQVYQEKEGAKYAKMF